MQKYPKYVGIDEIQSALTSALKILIRLYASQLVFIDQINTLFMYIWRADSVYVLCLFNDMALNIQGGIESSDIKRTLSAKMPEWLSF